MNTREVAAVLSVSARTVEAHRNHVMRKLQFSSFSQLVRYAVRNCLVDPQRRRPSTIGAPNEFPSSFSHPLLPQAPNSTSALPTEVKQKFRDRQKMPHGSSF
jgi:hypothetical protein